MIVSSYHYLLGPLVAVGAMGVLLLVCRWVFSTDHRDDRTTRRLQKAMSAGDFGLLVPVSAVRTRDDAEMLRGVLQAGGIRASVSSDELEHVVMVFSKDEARARLLVSAG